jgi:MFS family permease
VLLVAFVILAVVTVPVFGGRLGRLADLRFHRAWALIAALAVQFVILGLFDQKTPFHGVAHVGSYLLAGYFVLANRRLPGMWLLAVGGVLNLVAIAANGGVIPAAPAALVAAGRSLSDAVFRNSASLADPNLAFLGDIFALPPPFPFHNVFSVGDLCIALGAGAALHRVCGSWLVPSGKGQFEGLHRHGGFMRVWAAQSVSNVGDWVYTLAVVASLTGRGSGAHALAALLVMQVAPGALAGALGGPLIDRLPRKFLMISSDLVRSMAVGSLLLVGQPSLGHLYLVAACLGLFGSIFQPSLNASIPNLVPRHRIVAANALVGATYNFAVMAGPVIGGLLVAGVGASWAFGLQTISFALSAVLIMGVRFPKQTIEGPVPPPVRALVEGIRYAVSRPVIWGAFIVIGLVMFASSVRSPLEPLFVMRTLRLPAEALGLVGGVWGLGMVLGSVAAPGAARRWSREWLLAAAIAVVGLAVIAASQVSLLSTLLLLWLMCGFANGVGSVAYHSLLQERTHDSVRGRVMAASEAVFQIALLAGASTAGWFGTHLGVRTTYAVSGFLFVATALLCRALLGAAPLRDPSATVGPDEKRSEAKARPTKKRPSRAAPSGAGDGKRPPRPAGDKATTARKPRSRSASTRARAES